ncbi:hypothetical protein [Paracidovorax cattleyae]|uniref:hypothetical protein n=1 Tax=Paracidovorax cattleyae TaxID=80868 RepID=UPI0018AF88CC|nr:hypothetical protein [Paracidovorax cattleyae]MBF9265215.1 hypothetical protein [Paracidovorax cattleyae]
MNIFENYDAAVELATKKDFFQIDLVLKHFENNYLKSKDAEQFIDHVLEKYVALDVSVKKYLLNAFLKIDMKTACRLAEKDLATAYQQFRWSGESIHQILSIMAQMEGVKLPTISLNYNQNMAIALAVRDGASLKNLLHDQAMK